MGVLETFWRLLWYNPPKQKQDTVFVCFFCLVFVRKKRTKRQPGELDLAAKRKKHSGLVCSKPNGFDNMNTDPKPLCFR